MSARLHLCGRKALERLLPMVEAFHAEEGIDSTEEARRAALAPLTEGNPYGAAYLIGPVRAPVGYLVVTFSWSVEFGGMDAMLDEIWVRPAVRGRGMASEAVHALAQTLAEAGLTGLSLEAERGGKVVSFYQRLGFEARERYILLSRRLS